MLCAELEPASAEAVELPRGCTSPSDDPLIALAEPSPDKYKTVLCPEGVALHPLTPWRTRPELTPCGLAVADAGRQLATSALFYFGYSLELDGFYITVLVCKA